MPKKNKGQTLVCIYPDWCKGCGLCVAFCPGKVLELNALGKAEVVHPEECINCGFCELHCPDFAIAIKPKDNCPFCDTHGKAAPNSNSDEY